MKLATLLITSLLAMPSVAAARPAISVRGQASLEVSLRTKYRPVVVRDHRRSEPVYIPAPEPVYAPEPSWAHLGTVSTGTQDLRVIDGPFDSLMLKVHGVVDLEQVIVIFTDAQMQKVLYRKTFTDRMAPISINLAGTDRKIQRVIVYSADDRQGEITVLAKHSGYAATPEPYSRWTKLGAVATGDQSLRLDRYGALRRLAFSAKGRVYLQKVRIQYTDGSEQVAEFNRTFTSGMSDPVIRLSGRVIKHLIVYTDDSRRGELTVYGF